jgi:hypothetical protein
MTNSEIERRAIEYVLGLEREAGRIPEDVSRRGVPYDISSPPRKIEVKASGGSARGAAIPLEGSQVAEAKSDPENFYLYVVDNVATSQIAVRVVHGDALAAMIERTTPRLTYWPTLRSGDYDRTDPGV